MSKKTSISNQISLLAKITDCSDSQAVHRLIMRAFDIANLSDELGIWNKRPDEAILEEIISLVQGIQPKDTIEMILACQFVAIHLRAMAKLSTNDASDTSHGMMLMRLSHQALEMLQKHRNKGSNINVNYFVKNEGQAVIQTHIDKNLLKKQK